VVEQHCNMHVQEAMLYSALLRKFTVVSIFGDAMYLNSICVRLCMAADKVAALSGLCMNNTNSFDFITNLHAKSWLCCIQITPLLNELRQGNLVGNLEALTKSASEAASDIHNLQTEVPSLCVVCMFCSIMYDVTEP